MATQPIFEDVKPWPMAADTNPRAVIGGNQPPIEERIPAEFREALLEEKPHFLTVLEKYVGKGDPNSEGYVEGAAYRAKASDEETLARCGDLQSALRKAEAYISGVHTAQKAPFLLGGRLVDAEKNAFVGPGGSITRARNHVQRVMDDYTAKLINERRKSAADAEADRQRLLALARENDIDETLVPVAAAPKVAAPIRSDAGSTISIGTRWEPRIIDFAKAYKKVKDDAKVKEVIEAAIKRLAKASGADGDTKWPGVEFTEVAKSSAR